MVRQGKAAPAEPELAGPRLRLRQRRVPPPQGVGDGGRPGVREHRQHVGLGVPEGVAVVAGAGETFRGDRPLLRAHRRLQHAEHREPDGLLERGVALDLDVGARPEVVEELALVAQEARPSRCAWRR